jgi:HAE1 family hydrophobic/amphiphilic exporter-1
VSSSGATMTATLKKDRAMTTAQVVDEWNELAADMTNMDVTVASSGSSMSSMMSTGSYEIDLQGNSMDDLRTAAEMLSEGMRQIDGVVKVDNSLANASTLVKVDVDPMKAMQYGLTPITVGMTLNNVISGVNPLTITKDGSEYEVWLEYPEGQYDDLNQIMDLMLPTSVGVNIPLRDIAQLVYTEGQESISRQNGMYYVSVTATLSSEKTYSAQDAINALVDEMDFPDSVTPADSMMTDMMNEELMAIFKAILIAIFLVFLVMAMQFESPRFSIMVMTCIPFALIGSFLLLWITGQTLSMISLMGFLMLMGIVVNNGILFVDSTNMLRKEMPVEDALIEAGCIRLRPILMTTLTTILSMLPLGIGIGTNAVMMKGMALVIIGGLVASTILTLILIPTFYLVLDKKKKVRAEE